MSLITHVRSIAALEALRLALLRFRDASHATMQGVEYELKRTFEWLRERQFYWSRELAMRGQQLARAESALRACLTGGDSDCSDLYSAVARARHRLHEAETELRTVETHLKRVEHAAEQYSLQARKLINNLQTNLPKGTGLLRQSVALLFQYTIGGAFGPAPATLDATAISIAPLSGADQVPTDSLLPAFPGEHRGAVDSGGTFISDEVLYDHASRHSRDVGAASVADYLRLAQNFISGFPDIDTLQLKRLNGDIVRWNMRTSHFGIVDSDGTLVTYYTLSKKKDPLKYFLNQYEHQR